MNKDKSTAVLSMNTYETAAGAVHAVMVVSDSQDVADRVVEALTEILTSMQGPDFERLDS